MRKLTAIVAIWFALATPLLAQQSVFVPATMASATFGAITTMTQLVAGIAKKSIYITALREEPTASSVVTWSYGTGTNCGTGTVNFLGPVTYAAFDEIQMGTGYGALFVIPQGNSLCITISTAVSPGWVSYSQF